MATHTHATPAQAQTREVVTPAAVHDAALSLFAERGYHGAALRQIASRLHVQTPSLYNHMASKQDLLEAIITDTTNQVWADFESAVADLPDVRARLRQAVVTYALRHATHPREAIITNREIVHLDEPARSNVLALRRRHEQAIRALIVQGVEQGAFQTRSPLLVSFTILEMCVSIAHWYQDAGSLSAQEIADTYGTFALRLVTSPE